MMVHPRELLRTDSNEGREFAAPRNIFNEHPIDYGIVQLPFLNRIFPLETFANFKVFITFLSIAALLQGAALSYFNNTSKIWAEHYHLAHAYVEWLIYMNEVFIGAFALAVAYWGNKIHRMSWLGGLTIFQAINAIILIVTEAHRTDYKHNSTALLDLNLCRFDPDLHDEDANYIAFVLIVIYQIFVSMSTISLITHGLTYLDDNTSKHNSPAYIGVVLAVRELGKQGGFYLSGIPMLLNTEAVFISIAWILLAVTSFFIGTMLAMFPQTLPAIISKRLSASIVDMVSNQNYTMPQRMIDSFLKTILRLIRNKILMLNILCALLLKSALINFNIFEKFSNQTRFGVSAKVESIIPWTVYLLKQPLVAISLVATGAIIAKTRPSPKSLVKWNIIVLVLVIIFFSSTAFFNCEPNIESPDMSCNFECSCRHTEFQPVCIKKKTYFSPCWAGCRSSNQSSGIYTDCWCGESKEATEGSCSKETDRLLCILFWIIAQTNSVISSALVDTTLVTNFMINMRCILKRDKALALGLEYTFIGFIPYLPVKQIYNALGHPYCIISEWRFGKCTYYAGKFSSILSGVTIALMTASLIVAVVLLFIIKDKHFAKDEDDEDDDESVQEMQEILDETASARANNSSLNARNREELDLRNDSLEDMENVGDDHDSVGSMSRNM